MFRYIFLMMGLLLFTGCGTAERSGVGSSDTVDEVIALQEALDAAEATASQGHMEQAVAETAGMEYENMEGVIE